MIAFPYRREQSQLLGAIYRPVAEVYFRDLQGNELVSFMYVDSGADITLIPQSFGESLGFVVEQKDVSSIRGVGNAMVPVIIRKAPMRIGTEEFEARIAWALDENVPPLLGRTDVFDRFNIHFRQSKRLTEFRPVRRQRSQKP